MRTDVLRFRFRSSFCFCRRLSSLFPPVVVFLNGEGGRQQALKGLLIQRQVRLCQVGPGRGHSVKRGEKTVQTSLYCSATPGRLKMKVWPGRFGSDSQLRMPFWKHFMKTA